MLVSMGEIVHNTDLRDLEEVDTAAGGLNALGLGLGQLGNVAM